MIAARPIPDGFSANDGLLQRLWARTDRGSELFAFHDADGAAIGRLTLGELIRQADTISGFLADGLGLRPGDRVILAYPPGLAFIPAFLGCLTAGVVPVPVYPPSPGRLDVALAGLARVARNCRARIVLTDANYNRFRRLSTVAGLLPGRARWPADLTWETTDGLRPGRWQTHRRPAGPDDLAFLQYTSGSSSAPRGVRITWANLEHQLRFNRATLGMGPGARFVTWVPQYHDLGLISGITSVLAGNGWLGLISPLDFLRRPQAWFDLVTRVRATHTAAPNFGYELMVRKTTPGERARWDLSSLTCAMNAAEPVLATTRRAFAAAFAASGFRPEAWCAAYGLAEHTVGVTVGGRRIVRLDRDALERERRVISAGAGPDCEVSSCGRPGADIVVRIVDPATDAVLADDLVGEIWAHSGSTADGYEDAPEASAHTFAARLRGDPRPYLRTGDLGFIHAGELFVTGRLKDLVILGGRNVAPQDIELAVQSAHPAIRPGGVVAFSVPGSDGESLVVLVELRDAAAPASLRAALLPAVCTAVARDLGVPVRSVALLRPGGILKTTSGKPRRQACRAEWLAGQLQTRALAVVDVAAGTLATQDCPTQDPPSADALTRRVCDEVSELLGGAPVASDASFTALGLGSLGVLELCTRLERSLALAVPPASVFDHPTPATLAAHLTALRETASNVRPPSTTWLSGQAPSEPAAPGFPLTEVQRAYWIGRDPALPLGGVSCHAYLELAAADLDLGALTRAIDRLVAHHEILRATISPAGRWQPIDPPPFHLPIHDLRAHLPEARDQALQRVRTRLEETVLPADHWPLFAVEAALLPTGVRLHVHVDMLVLDGAGMLLAARQLLALLRDPTTPLPPASGALARAHELRLADPQRPASAAWWREWLRHAPPTGPLLPRALPAQHAAKFVRRSGVLSPRRWAALRTACRAHGVSPSVAVLTLFTEVLAAWSATPEFMVSLPLFERPHDMQEVLGDFTSLMLIARRPARGSLHARALALHEQVLRGLGHRRVDALEVLRDSDAGQAPPVAFTSFLALQDHVGGIGDAPLRLVHASSATPQIWLDHQLYEQDGALHIAWDSRDDVLAPGVIEAAFTAHLAALTALADHVGTWDAPPSFALPADQAARRVNYLDTAVTPPARNATTTLDDLFRAQVARAPQAPALFTSDRSFTYAELACRVDLVAARLGELRTNAPVAIVTEKGWEEVVAALAAAACAVAYVPIHARLPGARIDHILAASGATIVLTQRRVLTNHAWLAAHPNLVIDELDPPTDATPAGPSGLARPDDLAYVIYTSGSTGEPKGVMIDHRGAVNTLLDINRRFAVTPADRVLALSSLSFDLSVYDVFGALAAGAALVVPDAELATDPSHWLALVRQHGVTVWNSVPALMSMWVAQLRGEERRPPLRLALLSGDWIPVSLPDAVRELHPDITIVSLGGATEASIWSIFHVVDRVAPDLPSIPYGRPLTDQSVHVLDSELRPCPEHVPGELYIGGTGVALGYWRAPELSAERFIVHPITGERLYRTGDRGAMDPAGHIVFHGRVDTQLKIRGFRVEPREIEQALEQHEDIACAAVIATDTRRLIGFVVPTRPLDLAAILTALRTRLPAYMVPAELHVVPELPVTRNGKIDRQQLATRALPRPDLGHDDPMTPLESAIAAVWSKLLGVPAIARDDDFFALGGDSLRAVEVAVALRSLELPRRVTAADLFRFPTPATLARALARPADDTSPGLTVPHLPLASLANPAEHELVLPLGRMQALILARYGRGIYHNQLVLLTPLSIDQQARLAPAMAQLQARHPALRTVFPIDLEGVQRQALRTTLPVEIHAHDLRALTHLAQDDTIDALMLADRARPFIPDGSAGALLRLHVLRTSDTHAAILYAHHHAILDGWSNFLLIRELVDLVRALTHDTTPAPHSGAEHLAEELAHPHHAADDEHARRHFAPHAFLPRRADDRGPGQPCKRHHWAAPALVERLTRAAAADGVALPALLLAAYARLLAEEFGQQDLTLAAVCNGRSERMSDPLAAIGFFWRHALVRLSDATPRAAHDALSAAQARATRTYAQDLGALGLAEDELFLPGFNYIRFRHIRDIPGADAAQLIRKYDQYHFPLYLLAAVDPRTDSAHLIFYADTPGIDEHELGRLTARYSAILEQLASTVPADEPIIPAASHTRETLPGASFGAPTPLDLRDGTRTWIRRWGATHDDVLLGLHGITTNSLWFTPLAEALVARNCCQVLAFDRRGAGVNERGRRGDIPLGYHAVVDEILEVARALASAGKRLHLGAWCGTASLAALAAARAPELFTSIVYLAPMFEESVTDAAMERLLVFRERAMAAGGALDVAHPYPFEGLTPLPAGFDELMDPSLRFYDVTPRLILAYAASLAPGEAAARTLEIPQCAFFGADDMLTDAVKGARRVRGWLPPERVHTLPGPHHLWFVSAPEVARRIDAFLAEVGPSTESR